MKNIKIKIASVLLIIAGIPACILEEKKEAIINPNSEILTWEEKKVPMEESIFDMMTSAHGVHQLIDHTYAFDFRGKRYQISNTKEGYEYQVHVKTDTSDYIDYMNSNGFSRIKEGQEVNLSEKDVSRYSNALNSVIYFSTLPDKLNDEAVNKEYKGVQSIKGTDYFRLKVTFDQKGGGDDFEDEYSYWINTVTHEIDYLAYNYKVNKGGVRFRAAYNKRKINDVVFQDYVNYMAELGTPLDKLPSLYDNDELKELSRIETENVTLVQ